LTASAGYYSGYLCIAAGSGAGTSCLGYLFIFFGFADFGFGA
jgi:hypothetical protein